MKKLSVLFSVLLCFLLCVTAYATELTPGNGTQETTNPDETLPPVTESRFMCDADGNGSVTAADARLILRYSVGLENIEGASLLYCDMNFDGRIAAPDARMALRMSVELEEKRSYSFEVIESKAVSCSEDGYIKGKCAVTGQISEIILTKRPHTFSQEAYCEGNGYCSECNVHFNVEVRHSFFYRYDESIKECYHCGYKEHFVHEHSFNGGNCVCGLNAKSALEEYMKAYVIKNGTYEQSIYYVTEYVEPLSFAVIYGDEGGFAYAYCGFGVEENSVVMYYDFNFDFEENTVEVVLYTEEMAMAYAYGNVNASKVDETSTGDAISLITFDAVPELYGYESTFRQMMEGAVYDMVDWLEDFAAEKGFKFADEAFSDFTQVKSYIS